MTPQTIFATIFTAIRTEMCPCRRCESFHAPIVFDDCALRGANFRIGCEFGDSSFDLALLVTIRLFRCYGVPLRQYVCGPNDVLACNLSLIEQQLAGRGSRNVVFDTRVLHVIVRSSFRENPNITYDALLADMTGIITTLPQEPLDFIGGLEGVLGAVHAFSDAYRAGRATLPVPTRWAAPTCRVAVEPSEELFDKPVQSVEELLRNDLHVAIGGASGGASGGAKVSLVRNVDGSFDVDMATVTPVEKERARQVFADAMSKMVSQEFGCDATVLLDDMFSCGTTSVTTYVSSPSSPGARGGVRGGVRDGVRDGARATSPGGEFDISGLRAVLEEMEAEEAAKVASQSAKQAAKAAKAAKKTANAAKKATTTATAAVATVGDDVNLLSVAVPSVTVDVYEESDEVRAARMAVCVVCMDAHVSVAFECGHVCVCENCYDHARLKGCPLCIRGSSIVAMVGRPSDLLWPDAQQTPPTCANVGCVAVFPQLLCTGCKKATCTACTAPCRCKRGQRRKLFWS